MVHNQAEEGAVLSGNATVSDVTATVIKQRAMIKVMKQEILNLQRKNLHLKRLVAIAKASKSAAPNLNVRFGILMISETNNLVVVLYTIAHQC